MIPIKLKKPKDEIIKEAYNLAFKYEAEFGGCAQTTLAGIFDALGIWDDNVFKAANSLAVGGGITGEGTCGALAGGALAIGYIFGRTKENFANQEVKRQAYRISNKYYNLFIKEFGSPLCCHIQRKLFGRKFDFENDPNALKAFKELGGHKDKCTHVAGTAAKLAVEIILEYLESKK